MGFASVIGASNHNLKSHNISAILLTLLHSESTSRAYLAQVLGVSNATITNLIAELIEQGLVIERGVTRSGGSVGRPQRVIELVPNARFAVGVHIDVGTVYIGLANAIGELIVVESFNHSLDDSWKTVLDDVIKQVLDLINRYDIQSEQLIGIGVAASGLVDVENGINILAPNLGWRDVPLKDYLQQRLPAPIMIDNNVRAMALSEAMFGIATKASAIAFIYGRIGVGAGLVVDGKLFRGAGAGAGEIGHTVLALGNPTDTPQRLEELISEPTIVTLVRELGTAYADMNRKDIFDAARNGNHAIQDILQQRAYYLGVSLANLVNIFNPQMIILGGIFQEAADLMLPSIESTIHQFAFANLGESVELQVSKFGYRAGVIGAIGLALDTFFYRPTQQIRT